MVALPVGFLRFGHIPAAGWGARSIARLIIRRDAAALDSVRDQA
jgi:hypothetical protein